MKLKTPPRTHCLAVRPACVVALLLLVAAANPMHAQRPAGPHHPAGVPDNYLITPFGYFHPSCVIGLAKGDTQVDDGHAIQHQDGSITQVSPCAYPRYTAKGEKIAPNGTKQNTPQNVPSVVHNWIGDYATTSNTSFGELVASWTVPQAPTSNDGQQIFFFPGMCVYGCNLSDKQETILQPVLGWNANSNLGPVWSIASWNCCYDGNEVYSHHIQVNPGDTIFGSIQSTCSTGTLSCPTWNVVTNDETTGQGTSLQSTPSYSQTFNWAFAGVLEVYNLVQCSDYPPNGQISFSNLSLLDNNFNPISNPGWYFENRYSGLTPQCNYGGQGTATQVVLNYNLPPWAAAPTYSTNTIPGPSGCGPGNTSPCYLTYTATISVAAGESLYTMNNKYAPNGSLVNGSTYNYSDTADWGSGGCAQTYDQGLYCYGYAEPTPIFAYATEPGYADSSLITPF